MELRTQTPITLAAQTARSAEGAKPGYPFRLFQVALGQAAQVVEALDDSGLESDLATLFRDLLCLDTIVVEVFADGL